MSKNKLLFVVSILLVVLPFIGFPKKWEDIITVVSGFVLLILTYFFVRASRMGNVSEKISRTESFVFDQEGDVEAVVTETDIEITNVDEKNSNA